MFDYGIEAEMLPVRQQLGHFQSEVAINVSQFRRSHDHVIEQLVNFQHCVSVWSSQFVGLSTGLGHFQRVKHCSGHVVDENWLFFRQTVVRNHVEVVEELSLGQPFVDKVIVHPENIAGSHYCRIRELTQHLLLSKVFGGKIHRGRVTLSSCGTEVYQTDDLFVFGAGFGNLLGNLDVNVLELGPTFDMASRSKQVYNYI